MKGPSDVLVCFIFPELHPHIPTILPLPTIGTHPYVLIYIPGHKMYNVFCVCVYIT